IWIYRTNQFSSSADAQRYADAGEMYFLGSVANPLTGLTTTFTDDGSVTPVDQLELDNYAAPQFQMCVFDGVYFWGFGNHAFTAAVSLDGSSTVTLTGTSDKWFEGRNG